MENAEKIYSQYALSGCERSFDSSEIVISKIEVLQTAHTAGDLRGTTGSDQDRSDRRQT